MTMKVSRLSNHSKKTEVVTGFLTGLNTFQDETLIKDSDLTNAKNILLDVDGVQPRPGTTNFGNEVDQTVLGGIGYYKSNGTRELLRMSGGKLKKYVGDTPTAIGATTYSTIADVTLLQARDNIYIFNGSDNLSFYDGSTIITYSSLATPAQPTVTVTGTTGSRKCSYRISAFNEVGETVASIARQVTNATSSFSVSNYNKVVWTPVAGATGYNVWGREVSGLAETYLATTYTTSWKDDDPTLVQSTVTLPPEGNTTRGVKGTMAVFAMSRIFVAGDPDNPSRVYYGGVNQNIGNFSGSDVGGSFVDVFRNDGAVITGLAPFQGGVIIWKNNAIYKFSFITVSIGGNTVAVPQLEEITRSFGGISFRGIMAVENDIVFPAKKDGRLAYYSLGNQEQYAGSVLRTNELSVKIQDGLRDVNVNRLDKACAFYFNNIYGCSVSTGESEVNNRTWCLDTRFGAWTYWEGFTPRFYTTWEDNQGNVDLLFGNQTNGSMTKMFQRLRNDNGAAIKVEFSLKSFNQKLFNRIKKFYNPTLQFKDVNQSGTIHGEIYVDGAVLTSGFAVNQLVTGGAGMGVSLFGQTLFGEADGGTPSATGVSSDIVVEISTTNWGRAIKFNFKSESVDLFYKFLSLSFDYAVLAGKRLPSTNRSYPTS